MSNKIVNQWLFSTKVVETKMSTSHLWHIITGVMVIAIRTVQRTARAKKEIKLFFNKVMIIYYKKKSTRWKFLLSFSFSSSLRGESVKWQEAFPPCFCAGQQRGWPREQGGTQAVCGDRSAPIEVARSVPPGHWATSRLGEELLLPRVTSNTQGEDSTVYRCNPRCIPGLQIPVTLLWVRSKILLMDIGQRLEGSWPWWQRY